MPHVLAPVRRRDLVLDQRVNGVGIRHPQQRLGQTHERNAFIGREAIFGQKHLHQTGARLPANGTHEIGTARADPRPVCLGEIGGSGQTRQRFRLVRIGGKVDGAANVGVVWHAGPHGWMAHHSIIEPVTFPD